MKKRIAAWIIGGIAVAMTLGLGWWYISKPPINISKWDLFEYEDVPSRILDQGLRETTIAEVNFTEVPLDEAMSFLIDQMNSVPGRDIRWKYSILIPDHESRKITLRLQNLPVEEALRYVISLADAEYVISAPQTIDIYDRNSKEMAGEVEEADFLFSINIKPRVFTGEGPYDISEILPNAVDGVRAGDLEFARYYPQEMRVRVRAHRSRLEDIDHTFEFSGISDRDFLPRSIKDEWISAIKLRLSKYSRSVERLSEPHFLDPEPQTSGINFGAPEEEDPIPAEPTESDSFSPAPTAEFEPIGGENP